MKMASESTTARSTRRGESERAKILMHRQARVVPPAAPRCEHGAGGPLVEG